jgi:hypothetical protein
MFSRNLGQAKRRFAGRAGAVDVRFSVLETVLLQRKKAERFSFYFQKGLVFLYPRKTVAREHSDQHKYGCGQAECRNEPSLNEYSNHEQTEIGPKKKPVQLVYAVAAGHETVKTGFDAIPHKYDTSQRIGLRGLILSAEEATNAVAQA